MGEDLMDWLRDNAVNDYSRGYLYQQALDEIESLRRRLQNGSPVVEGTIQHMTMEIAALKKELANIHKDAETNQKWAFLEWRQKAESLLAEKLELVAAMTDNDSVLLLEEAQKVIDDLLETNESLRQRTAELEAVINSHGIPVKTYSGGVAHYCMKEEV